jgi:hypothetical protein
MNIWWLILLIGSLVGLITLVIVLFFVFQKRKVTTPPLPMPTVVVVPAETKKEVYNIAPNMYTYDDAKALCEAYNARLATYEEVSDAQKKGADWCNYGWSQGQLALYPTSHETWLRYREAPEEHRNDCGKEGVNGGYFSNPHFKFGVNCYGLKPSVSHKMPSDDYLEQEEIRHREKVSEYKKSIPPIYSFNREHWHQQD